MTVAATGLPLPEDTDVARECGRAFLGMSRELARAGDVCAMLEVKVSQLLTHYAGEDKIVLMEELQHLDILNQLIAALASYAGILGEECVAGGKLDVEAASELIGLARVAQRLRDHARHGSADGDDHGADSGEMQLF